ncbi:butyrophilin-like protein 1 isoform X2 [Micropterus salmoides]|uniref:butyrophilin-like protein 1 isoform X2 n=1 Tax=Micropterus salmoides TaxID=27706 RepID=UPI0018EB8BE6|nr:butyrophilin-like protein 1 isoform X2 [Micropterus salmoides]
MGHSGELNPGLSHQRQAYIYFEISQLTASEVICTVIVNLSYFSNMSTVQELLFFCFCLLTLSGKTAGLPNGASPEPSVRTLYQTQDVALLQCEVQGASSKPTVEWQDSAGNKLPAKEPQVSERGGSFYIILQTTVKKTDRYRCVATQEEIRHQIYAQTYVFICGAAAEPSITIVDVTEFGVLLQCEVRGAFPKPTVEWQDGAGNKLPAEETQVSEREGHFYITLQTTVKKTENNRFHCVVQQDDIGHMISNNITLPEKLFEDTCSRGDVTGWFLCGFSLGALPVAAVLVLLVATKFITVRCNKGAAVKRQRNRRETERSNGTSVLHQTV